MKYTFIKKLNLCGNFYSIVIYDGKPVGVIKDLSFKDNSQDYRMFSIPYDIQISDCVDAGLYTPKTMEEIIDRVKDLPISIFHVDPRYTVRFRDMYGMYRFYGIDIQSGGYPYYGSSVRGHIVSKKEAMRIVNCEKEFYVPKDFWFAEIFCNDKLISAHKLPLYEEYKELINVVEGKQR